MTIYLITEKEAAERLSISPRTLRKLRQDGEVHYVKVRSSIRYDPNDLARYVESARSCTYISEKVRPIGGSTRRSTVADFEQARKKRGSARPSAKPPG